MPVSNRVQLISYPDSMGGSLASLSEALDESFPGLFRGGIHVLPPYPSSGDRGFAPIDYSRIDPAFGGWEDLRRLGRGRGIVLDLMVNHISRRSPQFQDYLERGEASPWADLFIPLAKIWPGGEPRSEDLAKIFLRRERPYSAYRVSPEGRERLLWTTFGKEDPSEQVDLDWRSPAFSRLMEGYFELFAANGVGTVRLDAVGYAVKRPGTSCFFVEPEIWEFLDSVRALAQPRGIELLPELHAPLELQRKLSDRGYWTYDFVLPYRIIEAVFDRDATRLLAYLDGRPPRQFTMLDCHDGLPVKPDLDGLYRPEEARRLVEACLSRGGDLSLVRGAAHKDPDGFDVHQIRGTIRSLLGSDGAYLVARAIQLFVPGVPQVYYVGLLAGENDPEARARTGDGRALNRHDFSREEIREAAGREVVRRQVRLLGLRDAHPAFDGSFSASSGAPSELELAWRGGGARCELRVDLAAMTARVSSVDEAGRREDFEV